MTVLLEHIDLQIYYGGATSYSPLSASYELVADQCIVAKAEVKTPRPLFQITPQSKLKVMINRKPQSKFIDHSSMFNNHRCLVNIIDV